MNEAKVIQVIETVAPRGHGTSEDDCIRPVRQYWSLDGALLAEVDPVEEQKASQAAHLAELQVTLVRNMQHADHRNELLTNEVRNLKEELSCRQTQVIELHYEMAQERKAWRKRLRNKKRAATMEPM